jgi:putative hydrolase of the HAD superfamily
MTKLTTIGLDADDTLWHNEKHFHFTQGIFADLLKDHVAPDHLADRLLQAEKKNLAFYGFGIKGFTLSMIETAIDVTDGKVSSQTLKTILDAGRDMLHHPVELLPHVAETLEALSAHYKLVLITKGDLFDQERKVAASGLGDFFAGIEIVSDKQPTTYGRIFSQFGSGPEASLMAGNSLKSDVIPALHAGAFGVHVPHEFAWAHEHADPPDHPRFRMIEEMRQLPTLIQQIAEVD